MKTNEMLAHSYVKDLDLPTLIILNHALKSLHVANPSIMAYNTKGWEIFQDGSNLISEAVRKELGQRIIDLAKA